ncbi:MAG TPA: hypothetical protein VJP80_05430 [Candidatus Saccharimonadales bacterium]|nr:hypothetical protein [Candidatus Saccharimonadales bacterium]
MSLDFHRQSFDRYTCEIIDDDIPDAVHGYVLSSTPTPEELAALAQEPYVPVDLGRETRHILRGAVQAMATFQAEHARRSEHQQDCAAFAIACRSDIPVEWDFRKREGNFSFISFEEPFREPTDEFIQSLDPGEIVRTSASPRHCVDYHFIVRVTPPEDSGDVLFASHFGRLSSAIQTFEEVTELYPTAGVARAFPIAYPR